MALIVAGTNHGVDFPLHVVLIEDIFLKGNVERDR